MADFSLQAFELHVSDKGELDPTWLTSILNRNVLSAKVADLGDKLGGLSGGFNRVNISVVITFAFLDQSHS